MPKALCLTGMIVAVLLLLVFTLDLLLGLPFGGASTTMNIGFILCAAVLGYLSWSALREQT